MGKPHLIVRSVIKLNQSLIETSVASSLLLTISFPPVLSMDTVAAEYYPLSANHSAIDAQLTRVSDQCGAQYCPGITAAENPNLEKPDAMKINMLAGIFLGCMVGACVLVAVGVDSLKR